MATDRAINARIDAINKPRTKRAVLIGTNPMTKRKRAAPAIVEPLPNDSEPLHQLFSYYVQWLNSVSGLWRTVAAFASETDATTYAKAWSKSARGAGKSVRVATPDR